MKRNFLYIGLIFVISVIFVTLISTGESQQQIYKAMNMSFDMDTKFEVYAGETKTITGKLLNTGWLWLYDVQIKTENLNYEKNIAPDYIPVLPIKYAWLDGKSFRIPQNFSITIKIPENETSGEKEFFLIANGSFKVYLPNDMNYLYYPMQIKQRVVLKVIPAPQIEVTDLTYPEVVFQEKDFQISMVVINKGEVSTTANISIDIPRDWKVDSKTKSLRLDPKQNETVVFKVIPTNTSGQISIYLTYPVRQNIINITKVGPLLTPQTDIKEEAPVPSLVDRIISFIRSIPPLILLIIAVILILIVVNLRSIIRFYKKRKKPEE